MYSLYCGSCGATLPQDVCTLSEQVEKVWRRYGGLLGVMLYAKGVLRRRSKTFATFQTWLARYLWDKGYLK